MPLCTLPPVATTVTAHVARATHCTWLGAPWGAVYLPVASPWLPMLLLRRCVLARGVTLAPYVAGARGRMGSEGYLINQVLAHVWCKVAG